jgi:hypothetical protein
MTKRVGAEGLRADLPSHGLRFIDEHELRVDRAQRLFEVQ